jgi:hypothetical protein
MVEKTRTTRVLRTAQLVVGLSRLSDPQVVMLAAAAAAGRLCARHAPRNLEAVVNVVRRAYRAAA